MISHEFWTPLGTALMFIDLVLQMLTEAQAIRLLNLVKSSLNLLLSLVHDMLDLKMIKENQLKNEKSFSIPIELFN